MGPHMWDPARRKHGIPRPHPETILPDLNNKLAIDGIEPLVLLEVQVPGWPSFRMKRVLENEKTIAVPGDHFEFYNTDPQSAMLPGNIVSGLNKPCATRFIRSMQ